MNRQRSFITQGLVLFLVILIISVLGTWPYLFTPTPLTSLSNPSEFSAGRAMKYIPIISKAPHPTGSPAHENVRDYLVKQMTDLGLNPELQVTTIVRPEVSSAAIIENIVGQLPGTDMRGGKNILLVAHYDSVPSSPGAADDSSSVAALLETARALKHGSTLKNGVIFLLTDAEEPGLLGAKAFVDQHPWARRVSLVFNFEARGNKGPVYTFETGAYNKYLMAHYTQVVPHPLANSMMFEVYSLLPNETDFTIFKQAGMTGFNFGFIGNPMFYHTELDQASGLDLGSLQQMGDYAVTLTRHFGNSDLTKRYVGQSIYFNVFGWKMISYPATWAQPLTGLTTMLFLVLVSWGTRLKRLTLTDITWDFLASLILILLSAGLAASFGWLISLIYPQYSVLNHGSYNGIYYWAVAIMLTFALVILLYRFFLTCWPKRTTKNINFGAQLIWLILLWVTSLGMPGASFLLVWPLLASLIGAAVLFVRLPPIADWTQISILLLAALPGLLLVAPLVYVFYVVLGDHMLFIPAATMALLLTLLLPQLDFILARLGNWLTVATGVGTIMFLLLGAFTSQYSATRPKMNTLLYLLNSNTQQAYWLSASSPDSWTGQVLTPKTIKSLSARETIPGYQDNLLGCAAPVLDLPAPKVELISDTISDGKRLVSFSITSSRRPAVLWTWIRPREAGNGIEINGVRLFSLSGGKFINPSPQGYVITLYLNTSVPGPYELIVVDQTFGLPQNSNITLSPRPDWMILQPGDWTDSTIVRTSYEIK